MSVLVLCPTRDNPEAVKRTIQSMLETSSDAEMLLCVDSDQADLYAPACRPRVSLFSKPLTDIVDLLNAAISGHEADIYGLIVDDARFTTPGWDVWLETAIDGFPKRLGVVSASHNVGTFVNFPYVSREWIETVGWYACPTTQRFCWDTVLEMLGEATRIEYAPEDRFHIQHDLERNDKAVQIFMTDAVQFLGWCVNERRSLVQKIRGEMQ